MFNFIDIYRFIPASACVGMGHSALLCPGAYNAAKMALYHYIYLLLIISCDLQNFCKIDTTTTKTFFFSIVADIFCYKFYIK
jgi:hypothetical protein